MDKDDLGKNTTDNFGEAYFIKSYNEAMQAELTAAAYNTTMVCGLFQSGLSKGQLNVDQSLVLTLINQHALLYGFLLQEGMVRREEVEAFIDQTNTDLAARLFLKDFFSRSALLIETVKYAVREKLAGRKPNEGLLGPHQGEA